jgi:hypothetical protein
MAVSKHSRRFLALSFVVAFGVVPADSAKLPGGGTIDPPSTKPLPTYRERASLPV